MNAAKADRVTRELVEYAARLSIVDSHQHLLPEQPERTDLCRMMLDDNYLLTDLTAAGLTDGGRQRIADLEPPLLDRWRLLAPFWDRVKHGSYGQAWLITLRGVYGARSLGTEAEVERVSQRISRDFSRPGLFRRILHERCRIDVVLSQHGKVDYARPAIRFVARAMDRADFKPGGPFDADAARLGVPVKTADDLAPAMDAILRDHHARGAVGFKIHAVPWRQPTREELQKAFETRGTPGWKAGFTTDVGESDLPLVRLYWARTAALAAELDIPVAVHAAAPWTNWLDFSVWEPTGMVRLFQTYRQTRFDLYHAGIPYVTQASMLGRDFPNVWLNLCWAHIISRELAARAISEWLDMVPTNKVIGFGGDHLNRTVPLTFGHLALARENIAGVLARRIRQKTMTVPQAKQIMKAWLVENPRTLYRL